MLPSVKTGEKRFHETKQAKYVCLNLQVQIGRLMCLCGANRLHICSCSTFKSTRWNSSQHRLKACHDRFFVLCTVYSLLQHCFIWTFLTRIALNYARWGAVGRPLKMEYSAGVFSGRRRTSLNVHMKPQRSSQSISTAAYSLLAGRPACRPGCSQASNQQSDLS